MRDDGRKAFSDQRRNARRRGVEFLLTFSQWTEWWESQLGSDWFAKRGCRSSLYCMARIGDSGAYELGNIKCLLHSENVTDASTNNVIAYGENAGNVVITEELARLLYVSTDTMKNLSARHSVSVGAIIDIRVRRTWRRATEGLTRTSLRGRNGWV